MQEKLVLKISSIAVSGIKNEAAEIESILLNELLHNKKKIEDLLISYYFKSRGRIYNVKLAKPVIDDDHSGFMMVYYHVGHFNACADVDTHASEKMKVEIILDLKVGEVILTGENFPEREPDEL